MSEKRFFFNGVDGATGRYLLPPMSTTEVVELARRQRLDSSLQNLLAEKVDRQSGTGQDKKRVFEGNAKNLEETGWGVIFAPGTERFRKELSSLLEFRREQATRDGRSDYYQEFTYRPDEMAKDFLRRHGVKPDASPDPDRGVPYYLLLVGDPADLPYSFQYELDIYYGVGRIQFREPEHYRQYARSVVAAETRPRFSRQVGLFGVKNEGDPSTSQTAEGLIEPLARGLLGPKLETKDWKVDKWVGPQATWEQLAHLMGGKGTPALLFTASHGLGFDSKDERQRARQGGLLCQDWPGPMSPVLREHYFIAEDLPDDAQVQGMMAFFYACHSAGTPDRDSYYDQETMGAPRRIADQPFVSCLCQRLLSHPNGGALAVIGHVDRSWTSSFAGTEKGEGADNYRNCLRRLLGGHRVGWAKEVFDNAYAKLSTDMNRQVQDQHNWGDLDQEAFAEAWLESNDARNLVVFGDPAVKLAVKD